MGFASKYQFQKKKVSPPHIALTFTKSKPLQPVQSRIPISVCIWRPPRNRKQTNGRKERKQPFASAHAHRSEVWRALEQCEGRVNRTEICARALEQNGVWRRYACVVKHDEFGTEVLRRAWEGCHVKSILIR